MFIWIVILAMALVGGYWVKTRRQRKTKAACMRVTRTTGPAGRARWAAASRARLDQAVPSWALLSTALSPEHRVQAGRPDVDAAVQLAAEIALSEPRKFRYNRGE